jgi:hypothetical protein
VIVLHAIWMMFITYQWVNIPYSYDNESKIMSWTSIFKNILLGMEEKPSKDSLLFINISYDKMLVPRYDSEGFESGKLAITDRVSLTRFLEMTGKNPNYKFIILDLFMEDSTSHDSLLQVQIRKNPNLIMPYHFDGGDIKLESHMKGWTGLSDYYSDFGIFLKYSYLQKDTCPTIPLLLYQKFHKQNIEKVGPFYFSQGNFALNSLALDFPVRTYDIFRDDTTGYNSVHLCDLVNLPPDFINQMTKNKVIVIGDFLDKDIHSTIYGNTAGPLIHLDAYVALVNGSHLLSWYLLGFLFINYAIISIFLFSDKVIITNKWLDKLKSGRFGATIGIIFDILKYTFLLYIINTFNYLLFGVHLNVLLLGLYIVAMEYSIRWMKQRLSKNQHE